MEWLLGIGAVIALIVICAIDDSGKKNASNEKKYRRSDLVFGRESGADYCVYCCSAGFEIVFRGTLDECNEFVERSTY